MRIRIPGILALVGLGVSSCGGDGGTGNNPTPGNLTVMLVTAPAAPGAVMFTVSGGQITGVTASGGYTKYETTLSQSSRRIMLTGNIVAGALVTIAVPDINKVGQYGVTINQVAGRGTDPSPYAQLGAGGFGIDVQ